MLAGDDERRDLPPANLLSTPGIFLTLTGSIALVPILPRYLVICLWFLVLVIGTCTCMFHSMFRTDLYRGWVGASRVRLLISIQVDVIVDISYLDSYAANLLESEA